jgi:hypothetical protein
VRCAARAAPRPTARTPFLGASSRRRAAAFARRTLIARVCTRLHAPLLLHSQLAAMFERQVAELLRAYLGEYIDGLDNESLNIRVWKGTRCLCSSLVGCSVASARVRAR